MANETTQLDRFQVWINNPASGSSTYTRTERIKLDSFSRAGKSLGGGTATLLKNLDSSENELGDSPAIKEGYHIKIIDAWKKNGLSSENGNIDPQNNPDYIVFYGFISSITSDIFEGELESIGSIQFREIGWKLTEQPVYLFIDAKGQVLSSPPDFNPTLADKIYGNKKGTAIANDEADFAETTVSGAWPSGSTSKVWNLKEVIEFILASAKTPSIDLEIKNDSTGGVPEVFTTIDPPRSFPSYIGQSIMNALDDLIEDPMGWRLDYTTSSSGVTLVIYNKSNADGQDDLPAGDNVALNLNNLPRVQGFNITEVREAADKVTIRGKQILCCGALTPWQQNSFATLEKDWTDAVEERYVSGSDNTSEIVITPGPADKFRSTVPAVYRNFKIKYQTDVNGRNVAVTTRNAGDKDKADASDEFKSFFPMFDMTGSSIVINQDFTQSNNHATPNALNFSWSDKLPIFKSGSIDVEGGTYDFVDDHLLEPMLILPSLDEDDNIVWFDAIRVGAFGNPIKPKLTLVGNKLQLDVQPAPQVYAWEESLLLEGGSSALMKSLWSTNPGGSSFNPQTSEKFQVGSKSHWSRFIFVVAAFSDQRLEVSQTKEGVVNPVNHKVLDDDNLQLWFLHEGTPTKINYSSYDLSSTITRATEDTFVRNDVPLAKKILSHAFAWLSQRRSAVHLEFPMNNITDATVGLEVGKMISTIRDVTSPDGTVTTHNINTVVESVNYNLSGSAPRISFHTNIPSMPGITRFLKSKTTTGGNGVNFTSSRLYNERTNIANKEIKTNPIKETVIGTTAYSLEGSSGESGTTYILVKVIGGNALATNSDPDNPTYPDDKPYGFSMSLLDDDNVIRTKPDVYDWTELDLPEDYSIGDPLPALPYGLCYVQLQRDDTFGGKTWNANIEGPVPASSVSDAPIATRAITPQGNLARIKIYFDKSTLKIVPGTSVADFNITVTAAEGATTPEPIYPLSYSLLTGDENGILLTLSRSFKPDDETATVNVGRVFSNTVTDAINTSTTLDVTYGGDKFTMLIAMNGAAEQNFQKGDLVSLDPATVSITDEQGVTRAVPQLFMSGSAAQVHDHNSYNKDGLGRAFVSIGNNLNSN